MKKKISISVEKELLDLVDRKIKNYKFANRSHAVEYCIAEVLRSKTRENQGRRKNEK